MFTRVSRGVLVVTAFVAAMSALPESADAVLSGTNGNIVFASGRGEANDNTAKLYLRRTFSGTGGPATSAPTVTPTGGVQHRHPTWSPDRTKIAYAAGDNNCRPADSTNCAVYVLDLTDPNPTPQPITGVDNIADDRPAWSPDGTRIAYESEVTNGSNQLDIRVDIQPFGSVDLNLTDSAGVIDGKPAWSPDSQTLFYAVGDVNVPPNGTNNDVKIFREPADNSSPTPTEVVHISGAHAFQPSISPDGTRICYTHSATAGLNTNASIFVAPLSDPNNATVLASSGTGDYNCTWSPDGTQVAYVRGTFSTGDLVMEPADNSLLSPITLETTSGRFDGNPDWAPDGRPTCDDTTVDTQVNTPVQIEVPCTDSGPQYERTDVGVSVAADGNPASGTVDIPLVLSTTATYTPNQGFSGTDSFTVKVRDELAFGSDRATVTVNVQPQGPGGGDNDFTFGKVKKNAKKGTAKLTVNVPGAGDVELAKSKKVKGAEKRARSEGSVKLAVKPKGKAKEKLADTGKAKVKAEVTYTPDGGDPSTKSKRVKLKLK